MTSLESLNLYMYCMLAGFITGIIWLLLIHWVGSIFKD